jgi:hypothetical protein
MVTSYYCYGSESLMWTTADVKCEVLISGFWREVDEICALLGYYIAYNGNSLPTFRGNLSVPSPRVKKYKKIGQACCPETSVKNYQSTLSNIPEKRRSRESSCSYIVVIKYSNLTYAKLNDTSGRNRQFSSHLPESQNYLYLSACISVHLQISVPTLAFGELFRATLLTMHFSHRDSTYW